jgi:hypothetical protein
MKFWNEIVSSLKEAADEFDRVRAGVLVGELVEWLRSDEPVADPLEQEAWIAPLQILKGRRYFDLVAKLSEALHQTDYITLKSRRIFAQAMIELGLLTAVVDVLENLSKDCEVASNEFEYSEARGLLGRAYKQTFVELTRTEPKNPSFERFLKQSIREYSTIFQRSPEKYFWHGINAVALIHWATRNQPNIASDFEDSKPIANEILGILYPGNDLQLNPDSNPWKLATAAEACVALGDYSRALEFLLAYTEDSLRVDFGVDAFEYASTLRQLEEIWQFSSKDEDQAKILHVLRSVLLAQEGGMISLASLDSDLKSVSELSDNDNFEAILGAERYRSFKWYRKGLQRAASVVKISNSMGDCIGTGFVIKASKISERIPQKWLLVTNAHVVSEDDAERVPVNSSAKALHPSEVIVTFEARDDPDEYTLDRVLFSSGRGELDCTIATFDGDPDFEDELPLVKFDPIFSDDSRVYVIGHPKGGGLSFSLHDNKVLGSRGHLLHYRAPTEGGSSGSPVFTDAWDLIAIHHAGGIQLNRLDGSGQTYSANEGIAFRAIIDAAREFLNRE